MRFSYVLVRRALSSALALLALAVPISSRAQAITLDNTGLGTSVTQAGNAYTIGGGTTNGTNLFHSFATFNVPQTGSATFTGPSSTANVITRVTGGDRSDIRGTINTQTAMPNANFFFINPAGVTFGAGTTTMQVGGAVRFSTADYIALGTGQQAGAFSAREQQKPTVLSSAAPTAFGFLGNSPATISVVGTVQHGLPNQLVGGQAVPGKTLTLVGGNVEVSGTTARVLAPRGTVQIGSVASPSEVDLAGADLAVRTLDANAPARLGAVTVSAGAGVTAGDQFQGGGKVFIRSGQLIVVGAGSFVSTNTRNVPRPAVGSDGVGLDLRATESMTVSGGTVESQGLGTVSGSGISIAASALSVNQDGVIRTQANAAGSGGHINIEVASAEIVNGTIRTTSSPSTAGNITIKASGTVAVAGTGEISTAKGNVATAALAGSIDVEAADVVLRDGGKIRSGSTVNNVAGNHVRVTATNTVSISNRAGISSQTSRPAGGITLSAAELMMDSGFINTSTHGSNTAGPVVINANRVSLANGAQIASSSQLGTTGAGGLITINASDSVTVSGIGTGVGVGDITFSGSPNSGLFSTAGGSGNAGQVGITTDVLTLGDGGRISVVTRAAGRAGTVLVNVDNLVLSGDGRIESSTTSSGAGGAINVNAGSTVDILNGGLFSTTEGTGNAGQIGITTGTLTVGEGGRISVVTRAAGNAGTVLANVDKLVLTGDGRIESSTTSSGAGGAVTVNAGSTVEIINGASIRADSLGSGATGNIAVTAGDAIFMNDGSISTLAVSSDGGNISLIAPNIIQLTDSVLTTSVQSGQGGGGNIFIDPAFVVLKDSTISANAFGGPGGNITIIAENFVTDASSVVQASSALSTPGTVQIQSPENNVAGDIAQLPRELVDASQLLRGACSARRTGAPNSFVVGGRGGVPVDPDGYLPTFSASTVRFFASAPVDRPEGFALAMAGGDCWQ